MIEPRTSEDLHRHYADVRRRLRNPVAVKPDTPIQLRPAPKRNPVWVVDLSRFKTVNSGFPLQGRFGSEPWIAGGASIPTLSNIIRAVCRFYGISQTDIESERRTRDIITPRHVAMYLCKELTRSSLHQVGMRFNDRDHTTVLHAVRKITSEIDSDEKLQRDIRIIRSQFAGCGQPVSETATAAHEDKVLQCVPQRAD